MADLMKLLLNVTPLLRDPNLYHTMPIKLDPICIVILISGISKVKQLSLKNIYSIVFKVTLYVITHIYLPSKCLLL